MRKYRWPLVLFVVIPFVSLIASNLALSVYNMSTYANADSHELSLFSAGAWNLTSAVMLGVLYPRLRKTEPTILRLAWSYTFVLKSIGALLYFGAAFAGYGDSIWQVGQVYLVRASLGLLPMLWFAREASRNSLPHAFFLVFIVGGLTLPDFSVSVPFYLGWIWSLAGNIIAVWLVANFDVRGHHFRKAAAIAVVVLEGLHFLPLTLSPLFLLLKIVFMLLFSLQLVLIYVVRVRQRVT